MIRSRRAALAGLAPAFACAAPAEAAPRPITGRVTGGYTVIALAADGRTTTAMPGQLGRFRIVPPARTVTLQLRTRTGTYGGPVVVARGAGDRLITGVRAGARLGRIRVSGGAGRTDRQLLSSAQDQGFYSIGSRRRPRGAGRNGRVRLWPSLGTIGSPPTVAQSVQRRGEDRDHDGVPGVFDVDDDGDLLLDNVDDGSPVIAPGTLGPADPYQPSSLLSVGLAITFLAEQMGFAQGVAGYALNENAVPPGSSPERLEALRALAVRQRGLVAFPLPAGPAELDCIGIFYCSRIGPGRDITRFRAFPRDFDDDRDGFGLMSDSRPFNGARDGIFTPEQSARPVFVLAPFVDPRRPGGRPGGIGTGDAYVERFPSGSARAVSLGYVFDSVPALRSYDGGGGTTDVAYPIPANGPGHGSNEIRIDHERPLTLALWRPQRRAIPGEAGCAVNARSCTQPVDIGGLRYVVAGRDRFTNRPFRCPSSAYSLPDPSEEARLEEGGVRDLAPDRPTDRESTLTLAVDLRQCPWDGDGAPWTGMPPREVNVTAVSGFGDAAEGVGLAFMDP